MKLLIVIDMQNDFIDGALGTKEAVAIVPNVAKKIADARAAGVAVVFTRDTHQKNYLETQEGKNLPVLHCVEGSEGWQISSKLEVGDSRIFNKPSFGSMVRTCSALILKEPNGSFLSTAPRTPSLNKPPPAPFPTLLSPKILVTHTLEFRLYAHSAPVC